MNRPQGKEIERSDFMKTHEKKLYIKRLESGHLVTNVPRQVISHSPGGFEIGYNGCGPADFALNALLMVTTRKQLAWRYYQDFKRQWVAQLPHEGGSIDITTVRRWLYRRIRITRQTKYEGELV